MAWKNIPEKKVLATLKDGKDLKGVASEKMTIFITGGIPGSEGDVAGLTMTVDPSTYVMTTQLKDKNGGNVGSPATVDLPLESMVVSGEYDEDTKSIILTLKNGQTVSFSVADLVSGLQTEITSENPLDADLIDDSSSNQKLVTDEEKQALGEIVNNGSETYARMLGGEGYAQFDNDNGCHLDAVALQNGSQPAYGVDMTIESVGVHLANGVSADISYFDSYSVRSSVLEPGTYSFDPNAGVRFYVDESEQYEITDAGTIIIGPSDGEGNKSMYFYPADGSNPTLYALDSNNEIVFFNTLVTDGDVANYQPLIDNDNKLYSDLVDDTGATNKFMTSAEKTKLAGIEAGAEVNVQSDWNVTNSSSDAYIQNKPTNVSAFTNDAGYQNASQVSSAIASAVGEITSFEYQVVQSLPVTGEKGVIYLVANSGTTPNIYDEYIWVNNVFEKIGTTDIDLSGYATTQDLEDGLATKADAIDPSDLPSGSTQNGVITTSDHTDIDPSVVNEGQIVVDSTDGKVYIVSEITTDPQTGDPVIVWKEIQTDKEVIYVDVTVTDVQTMTFTVSGYTANDICVLLDAGVNVIYRLNLAQSLPGLAAGVYDFRPIMHASSGGYGGVMSSMIGPSGNNTILGIASHVDNGTSSFEMRYLQNRIDSNNKLSADLIDSSNSDDKTYQTGTGAPTTSTEGSVGEIYVDKSTGKVYVCTSTTGGTYTWTEVSGTQVNSDWNANSGVAQILNKPSLATVATSGSYNDLTNKPTIPAAQVNSDWNASSGVAQILNKPSLATVATTGAYSDLTGTPTIPTVNDAILSIRKNGAAIASFSANASSGVTANIEVPVITMQTTDPGEGASLAANNFIAVYEV